MKILAVTVAAIALAGLSVPANAFHPSDETYGYVMPSKFRKGKKAKEVEPTSIFGSSPKASENEPETDIFGNLKKKKLSKKSPGQLDGGPKLSIAPVAPPKVAFPNSYGAGTIVIDTAGRKLYYVLSSSSAYRYPIAVGRQGFTWTGTQPISRKVSWPDWRPPAEMLARRPDLPQYMSGGIRNPLGAMALYLGNSLYRIHGTNDAKSIGTASSSGCIRMTNGHVMHLSSIASVGTTVRVLSKLPSKIAKAGANG